MDMIKMVQIRELEDYWQHQQCISETIAEKVYSVLIFSKSKYETSTENVVDWIVYLGHKVKRINGDEFEQYSRFNVDLSSKTGLILYNDQLLENFDSVWIRRWSDNTVISEILNSYSHLDFFLLRSLISSISQDNKTIEEYILSNFKTTKILSEYREIDTNKLSNLMTAHNVGLLTPDYIITTNKISLQKFYLRHNKKVIIKDLSNGFRYQTKNALWQTYAVLIDEEFINNLPEHFYLTFFQQYIEKEFEIRTFYISNKLYSMAIFSQGDKQTEVDYRRYNFNVPNRNVPYALPKIIEEKLLSLVHKLNLSTGSIDLIKSKDGSYYFLEVNPVGQYGVVSEQCNYNLDKELAKYLTNIV